MKKWEEAVGYRSFSTKFGPIVAYVSLTPDYRNPNGCNTWNWWLEVPKDVSGTFFASEVGPDVYDDNADRLAQRYAEKMIKAEIKRWLR